MNLKDNDRHMDERVGMLSKIKWVDLTEEEILQLATHMYVLKFIDRKVVFEENCQECSICIVVNGRVNVVKERFDGSRKNLAIIREGEVFGEMAFFDGGGRSATIVAESYTNLLVLTGENMKKLAEKNGLLGYKILFHLGRTLSLRLRETSEALINRA
ncbi:MAG: hypothetical protein CSYNP_02811 [Syntrophus sp. SKADARSKE-3]|nr:hypothetical protein [Syntrophus sp. SKADARSKE-3]